MMPILELEPITQLRPHLGDKTAWILEYGHCLEYSRFKNGQIRHEDVKNNRLVGRRTGARA